MEVEPHDGFLTVRAKDGIEVQSEVISRLAKGEECKLFNDQTNLIFEKFHPYLTRDLLELDALSSRIDLSCLQGVAEEIIARSAGSDQVSSSAMSISVGEASGRSVLRADP